MKKGYQVRFQYNQTCFFFLRKNNQTCFILFFSGKEIEEIINDSYAEVGSNSSAFWVMVAALKVGNLKIVENVCWDFTLLDLLPICLYTSPAGVHFK